MKKILAAISAFVLLNLFVLGCSPGVSTTTPENTPSALSGVLELRLATFLPPMVPHITLYKEWAAKIQEATNDQVRIKVFPMSMLLGEEDMIEGVKTGVADIGDTITAIYEKQFPLNNIIMMPCMYLGDADTLYQIKLKLEDKFPEMKAESNEFKLLFINSMVVHEQIHTTDFSVRVPEDMQGHKIYATGMAADLVERMGGSPIALPLSDWQMSLERGLLDAMIIDANGIFSVRAHKFLPYHTVFPSGFNSGTQQMIMNKDTWNKLPADVQKVIDDLAPWMYEGMKKINDDANALALTSFELNKHNFITLTPDEEKAWREAILPLHEAYIAKVEAMGLPAQKVYKEALKLAEQYR